MLRELVGEGGESGFADTGECGIGARTIKDTRSVTPQHQRNSRDAKAVMEGRTPQGRQPSSKSNQQ